MNACIQSLNLFAEPLLEKAIQSERLSWYAVQTRARHEKTIAYRLREQGIPAFLPLVREMHRWSDRLKAVESPLFNCYLFAKLVPDSRFRVLRLDGVLQLVGGGGEGIAIPEEQIEVIRILVEGKLPMRPYPFLRIGQRVRIRSGALNGVEGILISHNGDQNLVISVDAMHRSLAVRIAGYQVEPI
jgi:transcription antitermination factor NusG